MLLKLSHLRMEAETTIDYEMWDVITDGPFIPSTLNVVTNEMIPKPMSEWIKVETKRVQPTLSFIPMRQAIDNTIIAQEAIYTMMMMRRNEGAKAIKINLEKAYDRLKWSFLQEVLEEIGLPSEWLTLIMFTMKTLTFSIIWNCKTTDSFSPTRGIQQGDPLHPICFLFVWKHFHVQLKVQFIWETGSHYN
ncbi:Non-LTR retroelement reverse transcriptase-like protein [Theobroma cacao]|uniref:Non-LTR retroelement reverse transcriptase-like protein n=1 Tax=Theobroma cacao TaxID=3641 RepID=A0A061EDU8_THECC|nr:Non-LTR retroelement reverse transcriptase-like protein [Theobroma cacao]